MSTLPEHIKVPPDDIKSAIEKTAVFVKKNGASFEERLKRNDNDKFKFIHEDDEYHEYYTWLLSKDIINETERKNLVSDIKSEGNLKEKPEDLNFLLELPTISLLDLDIIKMTALYVAQNGEPYIARIISYAKKSNNEAQFEFLHKTHSLHSLFLRCLGQYELLIKLFKNDDDIDSDKIKSITEKLQKSENILLRAYYRAKYNKLHKAIALNEKKMKREQQIHYASINWQDYSIVNKIEFDAIDQVQELPVPISRDELIHRSLQSKREDLTFQNVQPRKISEDLKKTENVHKITDVPKGMKIKSAGESRLKSKKVFNEPSIKCPISGKLVPELQFDEHLRILLRDPKYKDQQDNYMKKNFKYSSNITTDEVYENIKRLARKRENLQEVIDDIRKKRTIGPTI